MSTGAAFSRFSPTVRDHRNAVRNGSESVSALRRNPHLQIATALIAYLLLQMAHACQSATPSLLTFTRLVRANLMHLRSINDLHRPNRRRNVDSRQTELALC